MLFSFDSVRLCNYLVATPIIIFFSNFTGLDAALVGLALTYISSLIAMLQYVVRQSAEVENVVSIILVESGQPDPLPGMLDLLN